MKFQKIAKISLILLIVVNFVYCISGAIHYPLQSVDVYSIWLLKAKNFYFSGVLPFSNLNMFPFSHPQYPVLLPFAISLIYKLFGVKEILIFLLYPLIYLFILSLSYKFLRKIGIGEMMSLVLTYVYSMLSPLLAMGGRKHAGEADIFLVLINWGILYFVFNYLKDKKVKWIVLVSMLIIIGSQIKMEGVIIASILIFLPLSRLKKILFLFVTIIPTLVWTFIRIDSGIIADFGYFLPSLFEIVQRTFQILYFVGLEMLNFRNWYIFWILLWMVVLIKRSKTVFERKVIIPTLLTMSLVYISNYIFATLTPASYVPSSVDRIFMQLSPLFFPVFALSISKSFKVK